MITFSELDELDRFVLWLGERIKKPVTFKNPIIDATLPDGSRINIVFGKDVSRRGSNFTIRKFSGVPTSIFELVNFGSLTYQMLAYLSLVISNGMSLFFGGIGGASQGQSDNQRNSKPGFCECSHCGSPFQNDPAVR